MIHQLFSYPLYKTKLHLDSSVKKQLLDQIIDNYNQNITYTQPGWKCDVFSTFENFNDNIDYSSVIQLYCDEYVNFTEQFGLFSHEYQIIEVWNNVYRKNYFQEMHDHIGYQVKRQHLTWFSGIHFLKLSDNHPKLSFYNPGDSSHQAKMFPTVKKTFDHTNFDHSFLESSVEPIFDEDDLIIFPSTLSHSVGLQKINDLRVTISFNVAIKINEEDE